ncbi:MAG: 3'-5' exonuclease, partial [Pyrinomonadaceae bacterium]
ARRIHSLTGKAGIEGHQEADVNSSRFEYRDIALLFRAMTDVPVYESILRRAGIPYQTVLGKGFYEREEITDLIQLLRFLDNRTDELALAAVLRSPLCGISDEALLALRLGPRVGETPAGEAPEARRRPRKLFRALRQQREIDFIATEEREALERATIFLQSLIEKRNRYPVGDLLRFAVNTSEFTTVVAANFDGAQRLANIQKLFVLAERFERSGAHLIRDFVKYVHDFEVIGSRESEGQLDDTANAVKLMTIHQAKGLEFPVVIIPDLQRISGPRDNWFILDRHLGLTLRVPNGRGDQVAGSTFQTFSDRASQREQFESLRLLYVGATRAKDRLILSAATDELSKLDRGRECWLKWVWQALELQSKRASGIVNLSHGDRLVQLQFTLNVLNESLSEIVSTAGSSKLSAKDADFRQSPETLFPLLRPIAPDHNRAVHRFSVTQLINYQRCPRQYYFERVLHLPSADKMSLWNDAEAPEPPANLTATLKGAVIHRFCETYSTKDDPEQLLRRSFDDLVRMRQAELADRLVEINRDEAIADLLPLARNYLSSAVFERVERARAALSVAPADRGPRPGSPAGVGVAGGYAGSTDGYSSGPRGESGLWSELSFRLRRPLGILSGAIDKLLITPAADGKGFDVEIIDFKTNRMRSRTARDSSSTPPLGPRAPSPASSDAFDQTRVESGQLWQSGIQGGGRGRPRSQEKVEQIAFDFNAPITTREEVATELSIDDRVRIAASDYQLQMQAYALAVIELMPALVNSGSSIISTLHFLEPNHEFHLADDLLKHETCMLAIDDAMMQIISSGEPSQFPVRPAPHCRMCNFLGICPAGREWLRAKTRDGTAINLSRAAEAIG